MQHIHADGSKRTLGKLTPFPGCCCQIGELHDGVTVIECEGMATGEAIALAYLTATVGRPDAFALWIAGQGRHE
ncbi:hypothetical protein [Paraburkholderia sp. J12]|uniref:hypothetical protein n=1 Tax=Paraburkholderia sp. J12 TaxID=2805432 RepID=UPI002ABD29D7|nr:hypothetical protein [Paraburkholderia sp. J12]